MSSNLFVNGIRSRDKVFSFIRFGSYSASKGCFDTHFKVLRDISKDKLELLINKVYDEVKRTQ